MTYSQARAYYRTSYPDASEQAIAIWCRGHPQGDERIAEAELHPVFQQRLRQSRQAVTEMRTKLAAENLRTAFAAAGEQTGGQDMPIDAIPQRFWTLIARELRVLAEQETGRPWWANSCS